MHRISAGAALQDGGRPGYRKFGVPYGGAFDRESLVLANALVGNDPTDPAIEMALMGGMFESTVDCSFAVVGASARCGRFGIRKGSTFEIVPLSSGVRTYLAAAGGFGFQPILGSASGIEISSGSALPLKAPKLVGNFGFVALADRIASHHVGEIRFVTGPQASLFDIGRFIDVAFEVDMNSDRKGVRLSTQFQPHSIELPSEPAAFGAIQILPSGKPIIIGPDGPTIGGYPKIGCVISADLDKLGQLAPGASIRFTQVSLEEAHEAHGAYHKRLSSLTTQIKIAI